MILLILLNGLWNQVTTPVIIALSVLLIALRAVNIGLMMKGMVMIVEHDVNPGTLAYAFRDSSPEEIVEFIRDMLDSRYISEITVETLIRFLQESLEQGEFK